MDRSLEQSDLRSRILSLLRLRGNRVLAVSDIHERLGAGEGAAPSLSSVASTVDDLEREGAVVAVRGKRYSLLEFTPYAAGAIRIGRDGFGTIRTEGDAPDIAIDQRALKGAMDGDVVLVRVDPKEGKRLKLRGRTYAEGEVSRVLKRAHLTVVGRYHAGDYPFVRPFDDRLDEDILVEAAKSMGARHGEMVNVEIDQYSDRHSLARGRIAEVLGMIGEPGVDIEVVIRKHRIPFQFPEEVIAEAEAIPEEIDPAEIAGRVDLRGREIVTIDGETAKDFDDAVEVSVLPNGHYLLGVHIADVAHYVTEGSALDREAYERGTSVYFPGRVVPMLPERLSNGICSLNPKVDRLTFSAEIEIDAKGKFVGRKTYKSVIRTRARMTYTDVFAILEGDSPELEERYRDLLPAVRRMHELYQLLAKRRDARGSIDFDLPQGEVLLGSGGEIESIQPSERNTAHRLIEEFMLAANEVVAQQLFFALQPALYRVHHSPDPQRVSDLKEILKEFKVKLRGEPETIRPGELQRVLRDVAGTPEERFLTELVLRTMKRAVYSESCDGHFALALQNYSHFTSPIRRYPDLIVHRMLAELLAGGAAQGERRERLEARMPQIALQSSERERRAEEADREVMEWKKVIFMRDKVGMDFSGRVTGVMPFGLFVELEEYFVQGLVPVASIGGDFWNYSEKEHRLLGQESGREFRLGDAVIVELRSIDEDRRQLEFRLVESRGVAIAERVPSPKRSRR
jgi:ribonuclease R